MYKGDVIILKQKTFDLLEKNLSWALHEHSITGACLMSGTMGKSINKGMLIIFYFLKFQLLGRYYKTL